MQYKLHLTEEAKAVLQELSTTPVTAVEIAKNTHLS